MRILIIKTTSLGDVVHNLPIIADIKKHFPKALIDWVVEESFAEIPAMHSGINKIIPVAIRRWRKSLFSKKTWLEIFAFKRLIQSQQYDFVIDTQGLLKSGLITYLSNSLNKCGYDQSSAREPIARHFYHYRFAVSRDLHAVMRNRRLAALALGYVINEATLDYGIKVPSNPSLICPPTVLPTNFILALHGTSRDSKLWAIEHWVALGKKLQAQGFSLVLPWGSNAELQRAKQIASHLEQALVLPKMGIASLANIIQKSRTIIGVDTGLAHLAIALNKPVIGVYTDTNPVLTGLYGGAEQAFKNLGNQHQKITAQDVLIQLKAFKIIAHD